MIKYTLDQKIYKTERHADYDIAYNLPLDEPGSYVLILKFVEVYFFLKPNTCLFFNIILFIIFPEKRYIRIFLFLFLFLPHLLHTRTHTQYIFILFD